MRGRPRVRGHALNGASSERPLQFSVGQTVLVTLLASRFYGREGVVVEARPCAGYVGGFKVSFGDRGQCNFRACDLCDLARRDLSEHVVALRRKFPGSHVADRREFDGHAGVWTTFGETGVADHFSGEVDPALRAYIDAHGLAYEWHDAATLMLFWA